ncbi:MAG: ribbon-helix-helix protein, CopG family [Ardenticatenales bacterium]
MVIRTVISVTEDDKEWLDRTAARRGVSMTEVVRDAIRRLRATSAMDAPDLAELLERTRGLWAGPDGLAWQDQMRHDW